MMGPGPRRTAIDYLRYYTRSPLLRMIGSRIAGATAAVRWEALTPTAGGSRGERVAAEVLHADATSRAKMLVGMKRAGDLREIPNHPILHLRQREWGGIYGGERRKLTQLYFDIVGESFLLMDRNAFGMPIGLQVLPPTWCKAIATARKPTFRFEYGTWRPEPIPATEVVYMRDLDPVFPSSRGIGAAMALGDELHVDEMAAKHIGAEYQNRGVPPYLIGLPGATPRQARELEDDIVARRRGVRSYAPIAFTLPPEADLAKSVLFKELSRELVGVQSTAIRTQEQDIAIQMFHLSPETLGRITNSNRATIDAADYLLARGVLMPRLEYEREVWQERVVPEFDNRPGKLILAYESPVEEDKQHTLRVSARHPSALTNDEKREMMNLEPWGPERGGDKVMIPANVGFIDPAELPTPEEARPPKQNGERQDRSWRYRRKELDVERVIEQFSKLFAAAYLSSIDAEVEAAATGLDAAVDAGPRSVEQLVSFDRFAESFEPEARSALEAIVSSVGSESAAQLGTSFNVDGFAREWIRSHGADMVTGVADANRAGLRRALESAFRESGTTREALLKQIEKHIGLDKNGSRSLDKFIRELAADPPDVSEAQLQRMIDRKHRELLRRRANLIATQETNDAANFAEGESWKRAVSDGTIGEDSMQTWMREPSTEACEHDGGICDRLDGQTVRVGASFSDNGKQVERPPVGIGCKCRRLLDATDPDE